MKLTEEQIAEISDLLDCGMRCYYHRPTGTIESHPDPDDPYFDPEPWQDVIDKIENDVENYQSFVKMDSNQGFQVLENFAHSLTDSNFKQRILGKLSEKKPFQNFKILIDASAYRQDWFTFKTKAYKNFVEQQIEIGN
ncbi:MAG: hypothetical protein K9J17_13790 [Flavobacteriales bacterium]|nr:hypothetical protein [Flavobacteriales bacterium]